MPRASKPRRGSRYGGPASSPSDSADPGPAGPTAEPRNRCPGLGAVRPGRAAQGWGLSVLEELPRAGGCPSWKSWATVSTVGAVFTEQRG